MRIISSGNGQRRTRNFASPSPGKRLWSTSSLNSVLYLFMKPLEFVQLLGVRSLFGRLNTLRRLSHEQVEQVLTGVRERASGMVQEHRGEYPSLWAVVECIGP